MEEHRRSTLAQLRAWYSDGSSYGRVSQLSHALQCARQAQLAGAPDVVVVGALLHDLGWKLARAAPGNESMSMIERPPEENSVAAQLGILAHCAIPAGADESRIRAQHDVIGSAWLRMNGFAETCAQITEGHVLAKRYLCFKEDGYYNKLSQGSKSTLAFQGGTMTAEEAAIFEKDPLFAACCEMRRWDEGAKEPEWEVPAFESYLDIIERCIVRLPCKAGDVVGTYVREGNTIVALAESGADGAGVWQPSLPAQDALRSPRATNLYAQWASRGYVVLRADEWLTPAEREALGPMCDAVPKLPVREGCPEPGPFHTWERGAGGSPVPSRTEAFVDHHAALSAFMRGYDSPLVKIVQHLAGGAVRLYKDKVNYKAPGGGGYAPHQDQYTGLGVPPYMSPTKRGFIAYVCMIAVDASSPANGCPEVGVEEWQKKAGWVTQANKKDHDFDWEAMGPYTQVPMAKGDLLIYDNYMPHRSGKNMSDQWRRALFGIYYAETSVAGRDLRAEYYQAEAAGRRKDGSARTNGRANKYHMGEPAHMAG